MNHCSRCTRSWLTFIVACDCLYIMQLCTTLTGRKHNNSTVQIVTVRVCTRSHGTKRGRVSPGVALPVAGSAEGRSASCVLQIKLASLISAFPALSWSWADDKSQLPAVFWSYFLSYVRAGMTSLYASCMRCMLTPDSYYSSEKLYYHAA